MIPSPRYARLGTRANYRTVILEWPNLGRPVVFTMERQRCWHAALHASTNCALQRLYSLPDRVLIPFTDSITRRGQFGERLRRPQLCLSWGTTTLNIYLSFRSTVWGYGKVYVYSLTGNIMQCAKLYFILV